jgi:leucyl-tRNA synthetase
MTDWYEVSSTNMYVGFVPMEDTLKEDDQNDLISKLVKASVTLSKIVTANSMDLANATLLEIETIPAAKKAKPSVKIFQNTAALQEVPDFRKCWDQFVAQPGTIKVVEFVDARTVERMTKCIVHFAHSPEKFSIFKEHFLACADANKCWNAFADRKFEKRDTLIGFEDEVQAYWATNKVFEVDHVEGKGKWLGTFPYPYMNGALHLGHGFTIMKVDFQAAYQRLKGKVALFPFSFHGTGMPIKACADRLKREIDEFGTNPDFDVIRGQKEESKEDVVEVKEEVSETKMLKPQRRANAKTAQKGASAEKYQWEIMESSGIAREEIPKFCDPKYWLEVFPPRTQKDLTSLGSKIDWRRSFTTTDLNPFYDTFIRWQFNHLKAMGKIKFGKRPTVYSPFDQQPCMDHDRRSGEKLGVSEYVIVKQEVLKPFPACLKQFEDDATRKVYFAPATLRPETMYGQTNCWILPDGNYGAYQISETEIFVLTGRAARNLAYQEKSVKEKEVIELATFKGTELMGTKLNAPLSIYNTVYVLPMMTISDKKTTGVVTSVPSDSPDDFAALRDLQSKPAMREKFGVTAEMCSLKPTPIIRIPDLGNLSAVKVVEDLGIKSQNDKELLAKAKDMCYKQGFYEGEMLVGEFAGKPVQVAKSQLKAQLIEKGAACIYYEPEGEVISRSGDVCVVALCDQWYINYGSDDADWQQLARDCLAEMTLYDTGSDLKEQMETHIKTLHQWACSRSFGLGSKIPWDTQWLVESLSDSTIYMAYYTIAQIIQGEGNYMGTKPGPENISAADMTDEVYDFIFMNGPEPKSSKISKEILLKCKSEFDFFYPIDVRVTGKDLLPNHMVFWIYNHVAFWPKEKWPKGMKGNGWLLLNGSKMSKSTGNFVSIADSCKIYGADPVRFAFALGGDTLDDPNFTIENVETAILSTFTLYDWIKDMIAVKGTMRNTSEFSYADQIFDAEIKSLVHIVDGFYAKYQYRDVMTFGYFEMIHARDQYIKRTVTPAAMNWTLIESFIKCMLIISSPILSHTAEYIWRSILKEEGSIFDCKWPELGEWDQSLIDGNVYIAKFLATARATLQKNKGKTNLQVKVAGEHPAYYQKVVGIMRQYYNEHKTLADTETVKLNQYVIAQYGQAAKAEITKVNKVVAQVKADFTVNGEAAFEVKSTFNEEALLNMNADYIKAQLNLSSFSVGLEVVPEGKNAQASPGKPYLGLS